MTRWTVLMVGVLTITLVAIGCSGGGNPVSSPTGNDPVLTDGSMHGTQGVTGNSLWGYYDWYFDFANGTVEAVDNRSAQFNANVTTILNSPPPKLVFENLTFNTDDPAKLLVDLDVGLIHPLPDAAYRGYDVYGTGPMGRGSGTIAYNGTTYSVSGTDQTLDNADGYTRWFNATEFGVPGLLGYTQGALATPGYTPDATVNGFKLFADGLEAADSAFDFVYNAGGPGNNAFLEGATNFRHYSITFPIPDPDVKYGYAVIASWDGELPEQHPANTAEAVAFSYAQTDDMYYVDGSDNGGDLILDFTLAGYDGCVPSSVTIESSIFSAPQTIASPVPTGGGATYSTYHVEITPDALSGSGDFTAWVMAQYDGSNYSNDFGVPNDAETDPLIAYFTASFFVDDENPLPCVNHLESIASGALPTPLPQSTAREFCVVGNNISNRRGVYYLNTGYDLRYYDLDYTTSTSYMTLQGNYGYTMPQIIGPETTSGAVEVDPSGGVIMRTNNTSLFFGSYLQNQVIDWWSPNNPLLANGLTLSSAYGYALTRDASAQFGPFEKLWTMWGIQSIFISGVQIPGVGLTASYDPGAYGSTWNINWAPIDQVGSVDAKISDLEYKRLAVDSAPQGISPFDIIFYYLEGAPDSVGVEVFKNMSTSLGAAQTYQTTIQDTAFVGTPVDICVLNIFGVDPGATGNWLAALEDSGSGSYTVALFDYQGTLIHRSASFTGTPHTLDVDNDNKIIHVWYTNAGTPSYNKLEWVVCP